MLPASVRAELRDFTGQRLHMRNILIGINLFVDGRYYYGNIVGLTDAQGSAELARSELDLRFAADRAAYPADYRLDLEECDSILEVFILPQAEIAALLGDSAAKAVVDKRILELYASSRNELVTPAWLKLPAESACDGVAVAPLPTRPARQ